MPHGYLLLASAVLALLCLASSQAPAAVAWSNGCDSTSGWTLYSAGTTWPTVATSTVHSGSGAWKVNNPLNRVYQTFTTTSGPVAFRLWLYDPTGAGYYNNAVTYDIRTSSGSASSLLGMGFASSVDYARYDFRILFGGGGPSWQTGTVSRTVGWHRMELYYSGSGNSVTGYVDGEQALSYTGVSSAMTFGCVIVGCGTGNTDVSGYENRCDTMAVLGSPTRVTFAKSGPGSITTTLGGTLLTQQDGYYDTGETVALTATPDPGYQFYNWTSTGGWSSASASVNYIPEAGNPTVTANFVPAGYQVTTTVCTADSCTVTGAGYYAAGAPVSVTASVNPGYNWQNWADDSCAGAHVVSTSTTYNFTMPSSNVNLYARCVPETHVLSRTACNGGTVNGPSGSIATGTPVTLNAVPNGGYTFLGWTNDPCGSLSYVNCDTSYSFKMPAQDVTLNANFGPTSLDGMFVETFEGYSTGGSSLDSIDKNDPVGPNQAANGTGNPWWGSLPPNGRVNTIIAHTGSKSLWATAGACKDLVNLQYRANSGGQIPGGVYLDWWFYDPFGPNYVGGSKPDFCGDYVALSYYGGLAGTTDHPSPVPNPLNGNVQQLALGMSDDLAAGYNGLMYQVRIAGDTGGYHNGWLNTSVLRSIGWHHARVVVGVRKPTNTNDVMFYIDNMAIPAIGPRDSVTTYNNFNILEVNSMMPVAGSYGVNSEYVYSKRFRPASVDDICFGAVPLAAGAASAGPIGTDQITWNWLDYSSNEDGFNLWDSHYGGLFKGSAASPATSLTESGLLANTSYWRWVCPYSTQYAGSVEGPRISLPMTYTLALAPVYGSAGEGRVTCSNGSGGNTTPYAPGTPTIFTAVNGFGAGPSKATKYLYVWDNSAADPASWAGASEWTSGTHTEVPSSTGSYYMHLRACNGDGVANPATLTLGPYNYLSATPVAKISGLWAKPNGESYSLTNKVVSAVWSDGFWIEETDRSAGIKVVWNGTPTVAAGNLVDVAGELSTGQERVLTPPAGAVTNHGLAPASISPLAALEQYIGGKEVNADTPAVVNGKGVYNVGLLVKLAGTAGNAGADFFYLDDGSGLTDGGIKGIKVLCWSLSPATSGQRVVTGVVGIVSGKPVIYATSIQTP